MHARGAAFVSIGEAMVVFSARPGVRLQDSGSLHVAVAGAEFNFAVGLARLGVPTAYFGAVGADAWGRRIVQGARGQGVDVSGLETDPVRSTGIMFKETAGATGVRVEYRRAGSAASAYRGGKLLRRVAKQALGLHFTGISLCLSTTLRKTCLAALADVPDGALRSFDWNVRLRVAEPSAWHDAWRAVAGRVNLVFATRQELESVGVDLPSLVADVITTGGTLVVRQDGSRTTVYEPSGEIAVTPPVIEVPVLDVVGAGDAFAAAVVARRLRGASWPAAVTAGHLAGAQVVASVGDYEGTPYWEELEELQEGRWIGR